MGGLCLGGLCPGVGVAVQGVSVWGECLSRGGLCPGVVSVQGKGGFCGRAPPPHPTGMHSCVMCERSLKLVA